MDVLVAAVNILICVFAFMKGVAYIKNPDNERDWWWQMNAALIAISALGVVLNFHILSKPFQHAVPAPGTAPPVDVPKVAAPNLQAAEATLLKKSQIASQAAQLINQLNA